MSNRLLHGPRRAIGNEAPAWPFAIDPGSPQARGLVEVFPFWEGAGTALNGLADSGIAGSFQGSPTWAVQSTFGKPALDFSGDGGTDEVSFGNIQHARLTFDWDTAFSIWIRCRPDRFDQDDGTLFAKTGGTNTSRQLLLRIDQTTGNTEVYANAGGAGGWTLILTGSAVTVDHDLVYVLTNDGSKTAAGVKLFVYDLTTHSFVDNGAAATTAPQDGSDQTGACSMGRRQGSDEFDGLIDELRFYSIALTPAEVAHSVLPETRWDLYREDHVPQVWPAVAGGPIVVTASLQSVLRRQASIFGALDSALRAELLLSAVSEAALRATKVQAVGIESAVLALKAAQGDLDAALRDARESLTALDASLTSEGLSQRIAALNAAVRRLKDRSASLEAAVAAVGVGTAGLDAPLAFGLQGSADLDLVAALSVERSDSVLEAVLRAMNDRIAALDAVIGMVAAAAGSRTLKVATHRSHAVPAGKRRH